MADAFGPVAYLTGEFPRATDTFIQREVAALREQGCTVETCTIRRTGAEHLVSEALRQSAASTFHVLEATKNPLRAAKAHLRLFAATPGRYLRALSLAWKTAAPGLRARAYQLFYFAEAGVLGDHLLRRGVVHLHNHFSDSSCSVAMLTSALSGIPFSYTMHGPAIFFEPMRWRIDEKIARARFVACISHFCRSQGMLFSDPAHWSKLRLVHCGVIPEQYDRATRVGSGRILFVGRLAAVKGVPLLFDALKRLLPDHPGASLTVIGDGPARAELEAMAAEPPLAGRVSFLGYRGQAEVAEELARSDMLVLPSFAEGVPVVLMEAMASRMPVIASQVAGIPELIRDGESGHVVPAGDVDSLADRMGRLLADPALRGRMGEAGRAMIEAEYDVRREAAWLLTLFKGEAGERLRPEGGMR